MAEVTRKGFKDKNGNKVSLIAKVINAITGHFAGLNNKGEVVDSGYGPSDFAAASHTHGSISNFTGTNGAGASVEVGEDPDSQGQGIVKITVKGDGQGTDSESVTIHCNNIGNLIRALLDPDSTPIDGSDNLITSQAVYAALSKKTDLYDGEGNYDSIIKVGQVNRDDDELDGAIINGKSVIRITVNGVSVYVDPTNLANLQRALLPAVPPAPNGTSPITNGQVYDALQEAEGLTVDSALSSSSTNPVQNKEVYYALGHKENHITCFDLEYNNVWKLIDADQHLEDMDLNDIMYCKFKIKPSASITYYAFGSLRRTWDGQGVVGAQVAVLGHLLSWSDQVQDEQEAERYIFDNQITLSVQSTNLFPTT